MTTQTLTLVDFILARIAEDQAVAVRAEATEWFGPHNVQGRVSAQYGLLVAEHMTRFDPARVLAECEAKRRIVEGWGPFETYNGSALLAVLALPYADHADYRDEWRP